MKRFSKPWENYCSITVEQRTSQVSFRTNWQKNTCCFRLQIWGNGTRKATAKTMAFCGCLIAIASKQGKTCKRLIKCGCSLRNRVFKCSGSCRCKWSKQHCTQLWKYQSSWKWWENFDENKVELDNLLW